MRKFHFVQPFVASYNAVNMSAEIANALESIEKIENLPQYQSIDASDRKAPNSDNVSLNNGYVSGAIDLDRALEEYYKSLIQ